MSDPKHTGPDKPEGKSPSSDAKTPPDGNASANPDSPPKEWTLMFYFASDNPLAPSVVSQLKAIKEAGFNQEANVIAQFDPYTENTHPHIFDVNLVNKLKARKNPSEGFKANDPYVRNLVSDKLWGNEGREGQIRNRLAYLLAHPKRHGNPINDYDPPVPPRDFDREHNPKAALCEFLSFCQKNYPARHYALFLLGHGLVVGNDIFLYDENVEELTRAPRPQEAKRKAATKGEMGCPANYDFPARHSLLLTDLGEVLRRFKKRIDEDSKEKGYASAFELIGFHSCSMSAMEVAYEIQGTANYMLASQGPAFVGSWPYRQILMRIFNDLDSVLFRPSDLLNAGEIVTKLMAGRDEVCSHIYSNFTDPARKLLDAYAAVQKSLLNDSQTKKLMAQHEEKCLSLDVRTVLVEELNRALKEADLSTVVPRGRRPAVAPQGMDLWWSNRTELHKTFPQAVEKRQPPDIKRMFEKIFDYCVYNSYDFQLAGYSYDLSLCDLRKLKGDEIADLNNLRARTKEQGMDALTRSTREGVKSRIGILSLALMEALDDEIARELILLAHWDAQSYWQEQYTDLYDFCSCLRRRCAIAGGRAAQSAETAIILRGLRHVCYQVMKALKCSPENGLILRSEFVGPGYQYSHGLSVLFPWSRPSGDFFPTQYGRYEFKETMWIKFLEKYLAKTKRAAIYDVQLQGSADGRLLALFQHISARVYNADGQLDSLSKPGSQSLTGDDSEYPSIKNYPSFTREPRGNGLGRAKKANGKKGNGTQAIFALSPAFARHFESGDL